jgi:hypothetical protein
MHGHGLAPTLLSAGAGFLHVSPGRLTAYLGLLAFPGLLRSVPFTPWGLRPRADRRGTRWPAPRRRVQPLDQPRVQALDQPRAPAERPLHVDPAAPPPRYVVVELPPDPPEGSSEPSTVSLNPIELALIAQLNLEMAHGYDAVAADASQDLEARRAASEVAAGWRERARVFELQAQRKGADPIVPALRSIARPDSAYTGPERRKRMRRTSTRRSGMPVASDGGGQGERRSGPDRRRRDRRGPELAPR